MVKLAQSFTSEGLGSPTKASVHLRRFGSNDEEFFTVTASGVTFDASNFQTLSQGRNRAFFSFETFGQTGDGYISLATDLDILVGAQTVLTYPLQAEVAGKYTLWMRVRSSEGLFESEIFMDGNSVSTITSTLPANTWSWISVDIVLPDDRTHDLGVSLEEKGNAIDKIYITGGSTTPTGDGPAYDESPFFTVHMQLYKASSSYAPTDALFVYDWKNSIDHVKVDDWYNFDITFLDDRKAEAFVGFYALVMTSSGSHNENFASWELVDNDEYGAEPSAIRV